MYTKSNIDSFGQYDAFKSNVFEKKQNALRENNCLETETMYLKKNKMILEKTIVNSKKQLFFTTPKTEK